ncbi:hypothetical protein FOCC_FOCC006206 [Frankliniella occidentalis]|nr:hypothetical protein FOCC_FOCC006206 [Frankliniella occidentalis]
MALTKAMITGMNVKELHAELRARGAIITGKKVKLQERLEAFVKCNNFVVPVNVVSVEPDFLVPEDKYFRDVNSSKDLPPVTRKQIKLFLKNFESDGGPSEGMYKNTFLEHLRYCYDSGENLHFYKASVYAEMTKSVTYCVYIRLDSDKMIDRSHCDCVAGHGGSAHCKHVIVTFLGIEDITLNGKIILRQTCTEKLQTFHKPSKKYRGSPIKSDQMIKGDRESCIYDPRPAKYQNRIKQRMHNLVGPYHSTMPLKCLIPPANPYAIELEHQYAKESPTIAFLKSMNLFAVSQEKIDFIEKKTRGQSENRLWAEYKRGHLSASLFGNIVTAMKNCEESAVLSLCDRILYPRTIYSKAVKHGILNEEKAIAKFKEVHPGSVATECGFFISKEKPHLGATPDRLLGEHALIEVKCPYSARDKLINIHTVDYLIADENGKLKLSEDHAYMYQIQGQLYCTGRQFCDLFVYTFVDHCTISVVRDDRFIENMLQIIDKFYEEHFLPFLLKNCYYRRYYDYSF